MNIILTGATGFAGGEVLSALLADPAVHQVTALVRRGLGVAHPKLKEVIVNDFLDYSALTSSLQADACIWCLGVSQTEVSKEDYIKITFDYALAAARAMLAINPQLRFCFVSGRSSDQDEKSLTLQGNIKGRTEKHLSALSPNVFIFRPAFIKPARPGTARPWIPKLFEPVAWVVDHFTDGFSVDTGALARCLIGVAKNGGGQRIYDNAAIRQYR
ncbi:NAD-dependent epimerase/dehydratase family protein [Janthinobacterium agaricidamnosum]|uniref:NAD-dependent epimerase/dehydratase domain-containing protein n=1 Tax=Janthinobacterium agaricidamnosum NBRC 102515 = DSM 9628 TaxID=1349767 RepID=W0V5Q6_9BURK|nr:NAD-dependent epimerase/dehydratase family protein [Janthinobacterium agaricidamnosum]CDG82592.1 putative uncharacterized protein [Janthinobacterium agaricidamnosum NBRC 102515 = DSM 9628]